VERIRRSLAATRIRESLRDVRTLRILAAALLALALILAVVAISYGVRYRQQEAALREVMREQTRVGTPPPPEARDGAFPASPLPELAGEASANHDPAGIPRLTALDVISSLDYPPDADFRCFGPAPAVGRVRWVCQSPPGGPVTYEAVVVGEDPSTILSVEATAHSAPSEEAVGFLGYVGDLCFEDTEPVNVPAWVEQNVTTGGQLLVDGAGLTLYGTDRARTLTVEATGLPAERTVPAPAPNEAPPEETTAAGQ
jgi:hypothetical protein